MADPIDLEPDSLPAESLSNERGLTTAKSKRKTFYLKPGNGFNSLELDASVDLAEMDRSDAVQKSQDVSMPAAKAKPVELRRKLAENFLAEIFYFRDIKNFRDKITPEFIRLFNEDEQKFLQDMLQDFDAYIKIHEAYINQLLPLFGYSSIDELANELMALPGVRAEILRRNFKESDDPLSKIVPVAGLKKTVMAKYLANKLRGGVGTDYVTDIDAKIAADQDGATGKRVAEFVSRGMPLVEAEKTAAETLAEDAIGADDVAETDIAPNVKEYFSAIDAYTQNAGESMIGLFAYARLFDNMSRYYATSDLPEDSERRKFCAQGSSHSSTDLSNTIKDVTLNRRVLPFKEIAEMLSPEWEGSVDTVHDFRVSVAKDAARLQEIMGKQEGLSSPLRSPSMGEYRASIAGDIDQLEDEIADIPDLSETHVLPVAPKPRITRTMSLDRLSTMFGETVGVMAAKTELTIDSMKDFLGLRVKAEIEVPFSRSSSASKEDPGLVEFTQQKVKDFNAAGKEKEDARLKGWKFIYHRDEKVLDETPQDFKEKDFVEVKHDEAQVLSISPEKVETTVSGDAVAKGASVTIHRHEKEDKDLAVSIMIEYMIRKGEKKICLSINSDSLEAEKLILDYAATILRQGAIPVLTNKEGVALSTKETKQKLKEMERRVGTDTTRISQHYSAQVKHIRLIQKEDKQFLEKFEARMQREGRIETDEAAMYAKGLTKIAIVSKNLTESDFIDKLIRCVERNLDDPRELSLEEMNALRQEALFRFRSAVLNQEKYLSDEDPKVVQSSSESIAYNPFAFLKSRMEKPAEQKELAEAEEALSVSISALSRLSFFSPPCPAAVNTKTTEAPDPQTREKTASRPQFPPQMSPYGFNCAGAVNAKTSTDVDSAKSVQGLVH